MRLPKPKKIPQATPNLLHLGSIIEKEYADKFFDKIPSECTRCKGKEFTGYDTERRLFGKIIKPDGVKNIYVDVKRYQCKKCGLVMLSDGLFYPNCLYGRPIVDLCLYLAAKNPYDRVEVLMMHFGIQVDGDTVKNYVKLFKERAESIAGLELCGKSIGINLLKILFGTNNVEALKKKYGLGGVESVSDETYPAKKGAKKKLRKENMRRKREGKKPVRYLINESVCVAVSFAPELNLYEAMVIASGEFNFAMANLLSQVTNGSDYNLTDGEPAYNCMKNREICLVHRMRNERKKDAVYNELKKHRSEEEISEYWHRRYMEEKEKFENELAKKYPVFVEDDAFNGAISTNAIEGGNWRIKYELRTPYRNIDAIGGRILQILISESMKTFSSGKPVESFGAVNSNFTYSQVMRVALREDRVVERYHYDTQRNVLYRTLDRVS